MVTLDVFPLVNHLLEKKLNSLVNRYQIIIYNTLVNIKLTITVSTYELS